MGVNTAREDGPGSARPGGPRPSGKGEIHEVDLRSAHDTYSVLAEVIGICHVIFVFVSNRGWRVWSDVLQRPSTDVCQRNAFRRSRSRSKAVRTRGDRPLVVKKRLQAGNRPDSNL